MKIAKLMLMMLAFGATKAIAQDQPAREMRQPRLSAEERAKKQTDDMKAAYKLTDEQVAKVSEINLKYVKKMDELRGQQGGGRGMEMRSMRDQKDEELKKVLTKEQFKLHQQKEEENREKMRDRFMNRQRDSGN